MSLNTTLPSFVSGTVVDAPDLNALVNALNDLQDPWDTYTPTWSAGTTPPTLGNGTIAGRYWRVGHRIDFSIVLTFGSTTTAGSGSYTFSLPTSAQTTLLPVGQVLARHGGPPGNYGFLRTSSASTVDAWMLSSSDFLRDSTLAWAAGDTICISGTYEAA